MKLHFYTFLRSFAPRRLAMLTLTLFSAAALIVLLSYRDGPAFNGEHVTGARLITGNSAPNAIAEAILVQVF